MKYILEPKGWPIPVDKAPAGLIGRMRKGKLDLFYKVKEGASYAIFNLYGEQTHVTGTVTQLKLTTVKESEDEKEK